MTGTLIAIAWTWSPVYSQEVDTTRVYELSTIVATADRDAREVASSTIAVSVLDNTTLRQIPGRTITDYLSGVPGLFFLGIDGLGYSSQATVRGFYGGGETEYLRVLVDGIPANQTETGRINWNQFSSEQIESIEIIRGGASALYGDASLGGVVNVITKKPSKAGLNALFGLGSFGTRLFSMERFSSRGSGFVRYETSDGFRANTDRDALSPPFSFLSGSVRIRPLDKPNHRIDVVVSADNTIRAEAGPLSSSDIAAGQTGFNPAFGRDRVRETVLRGAIRSTIQLTAVSRLESSLSLHNHRESGLRTLQLSADFADTQSHPVSSKAASSTVQWVRTGLIQPVPAKLIAGIDLSAANLSSTWESAPGRSTDFRSTTSLEKYRLVPTDEPFRISGFSTRSSVAPFLQYEAFPKPAWSVTLGTRIDLIRDSFKPDGPSAEGTPATDKTYTSVNPKIGTNYRYLKTESQKGNVFATIGRSFKAPTLAQRYDLRPLPVPFPPFNLTISNPELAPQYGWSMELGFYHQFGKPGRNIRAEISGTVYQIDMKDELDFSFDTFRYENTSATRHRGAESAIRLYAGDHFSAHVSNTVQYTTFSAGPNQNSYVKAIPRRVHDISVRYSTPFGLIGSLHYLSANGIFLDDSNEIALPDYSTLDLKTSISLDMFFFSIDIFNLTDRTYQTTGYTDPGGSDILFLYPAPPRHFRFTVAVNV